MQMVKCPVCGNKAEPKNHEIRCFTCGYRESLVYEKYLTLGDVREDAVPVMEQKTGYGNGREDSDKKYREQLKAQEKQNEELRKQIEAQQKQTEQMQKQIELLASQHNPKPVEETVRNHNWLKYSALAAGIVGLLGVGVWGGKVIFGQKDNNITPIVSQETEKKEVIDSEQDSNSENQLDSEVVAEDTENADSEVETEEAITPEIQTAPAYADIQVGETITFGKYEQDNDFTNGAEDIEWIVLDVDEESHRALILSVKGLDAKPYNEEYESITWADCTLRSWLNGTDSDSFYGVAFTDEEKDAIVEAEVENAKNPEYGTNGGVDTNDKVFLLSKEEVNRIFDSDESRMCVPTAYAIAQGAYADSDYTVGGEATCVWWLRSPGDNSASAAGVDFAGWVDFVGLGGYVVDYDGSAVRPALWINLES